MPEKEGDRPDITGHMKIGFFQISVTALLNRSGGRVELWGFDTWWVASEG